jgi:hypothetical protein
VDSIVLENVDGIVLKNVEEHCLKMWMDIVKKYGWILFKNVDGYCE